VLDRKKGIVRLWLTDKEDVLFLEKLIEPGDTVKARTTRVVRLEHGEKATVPVVLAVRAEKVSLEPGSKAKVLGRIVWASSDDVPLHKYHSFTFSVGSRFLLQKAQPSELFFRLLRYCRERSRAPKYVLAALDEEEAAVALLQHSSLKVVREIPGPGSLKQCEKDELYKYFSEVAKAVQAEVQAARPVFLLQPAVKRAFQEFLEEKFPALAKAPVFQVSHGGVAGIREAINAGYLKAVDQRLRIVKETEEIEQLYAELLRGGKVAYGPEQVRQALEYSAVEKLYVLESLLAEPWVKELLRLAEQTGAQVVFINPSHEAGARLQALGGLAALLRFHIE